MLIYLRVKLLALTIFLNLAPGVIHKGVDCGHTHTKKSNFHCTKRKRSKKKTKKKTHNKLTWNHKKMDVLKKKKKKNVLTEMMLEWIRGVWHLALKTTESALASEGRKKDPVCLHWPVENTDKYVFAGMGYVFTQNWQTDSPHAHRCYSRKLCKSDVTEENQAPRTFFSTQVPPTTCCSFHIFSHFLLFSLSLSLSMYLHFPLPLLPLFPLLSLSLSTLCPSCLCGFLSITVSPSIKYISRDYQSRKCTSAVKPDRHLSSSLSLFQLKSSHLPHVSLTHTQMV